MPEDKVENQEAKAASQAVRVDENVACETCGKFGVYKLGDQFLCLECYEAAGSCCAAEFVKDDGE